MQSQYRGIFFGIGAVFTLGALVLGAWASPALACSCGEKPTLENALADSDVVFIGRVQEMRETAFKPDHTEVKFTIFRKFKGFEEVPNKEYVVIYTPRDSARCGYSFTSGFEYLVYASGKPAFLQSTLCGRTDVLENAQLDQHRLERQMGGSEKANE